MRPSATNPHRSSETTITTEPLHAHAHTLLHLGPGHGQTGGGHHRAGYGPGERMASMNHESAYIRAIFGFIGIGEVESIFAENLGGEDKVRRIPWKPRANAWVPPRARWLEGKCPPAV